MKFTKVNLPATVVTGPADDMAKPRSSGLHLSQIYHSLEEELFAGANKSRTPMPMPMLETYRSAGFIWERVMDAAFADSLADEEWTRPAEFERDGICCSPDLINCRDWVLGETKFTWKSSRRLQEFIDGGTGAMWIWGVQMKGYCQVVQTTRCRLFAYFVNGDYKSMQPDFQVYDIDFTPQEIRENWDMLKSHARRKGWL